VRVRVHNDDLRRDNSGRTRYASYTSAVAIAFPLVRLFFSICSVFFVKNKNYFSIFVLETVIPTVRLDTPVPQQLPQPFVNRSVRLHRIITYGRKITKLYVFCTRFRRMVIYSFLWIRVIRFPVQKCVIYVTAHCFEKPKCFFVERSVNRSEPPAGPRARAHRLHSLRPCTTVRRAGAVNLNS
jgi:hypothetical protein